MRNTIDKLREVAEQEPVIKRMWIFGSCHKGTNSLDSDLDLAIELESVEGQMLGFCENLMSLWFAALPIFKTKLQAVCSWKLDIQLYAGAKNTPNIHNYLCDGSELIYEKR